MKNIGFLVGLAMLAGCAKAPVSTDQDGNTLVNGQPVEATLVENDTPNPDDPDSFGVVKICDSGTKVYLLQGGNLNGQYAIWDGEGAWEPLAAGTSPDTVCQ